MILKTIAEDEKLLHANALVGVEILDIEKRINNAGTFHFICRKCDGILFQDYENREALINYPSDNMLAEIAMKGVLLMLSKRGEEKKLMYINCIMFAYTENYFFSKRVQEKIETDENLKKLSRELNGLPNFGYMNIDSILEKYEPIKIEEIPNFLSEEYSLQVE